MAARAWSELERRVRLQPAVEPFRAALVEGLPEPAQRYLLHSIAPGCRLARAVRLQTRFEMKLREGDRSRAELFGSELLAPPLGFVWRARTRAGLLPLRVTDHYLDGSGEVRVRLLGFVPVARASGPDVTRSARGRLAGEIIWLPSALLSIADVHWELLDEERVRVTPTIDGDPIPLTLRIDADGRLREMTMLRHGDVGVESWQPIPYGVEVLEESELGGVKLPRRVRGGWWYGSERYDEAEASDFEIVSAELA